MRIARIWLSDWISPLEQFLRDTGICGGSVGTCETSRTGGRHDTRETVRQFGLSRRPEKFTDVMFWKLKCSGRLFEPQNAAQVEGFPSVVES